MCNRTRTLLPPALLLLLTAGTTAQQAVPPEVVDGWRNYTTRYSHASGDYKATSTVRQGQESSVQVAQVAFAFTSRCKRVELIESDPGRTTKQTKRMYCSNPKYAFRLDSGETGWLLREVVLVGDEPSKALGVLHDRLDAWLASVHCLAGVERIPLLDLADDLHWVQPKGVQPPALALTKERRVKEGPNMIVYHKLSLHLNDDNFHTLQTAKADMLMNRTEGTLEISVTPQTVGGTPVPVRFVRKEQYPAVPGWEGMESTSDTSFRIDPTREHPDTDFTLTAYGLPEPVGISWSKPTPNYVWLLAAAGGCVLLALACRYLSRRRVAKA
jgi:hypothetical protein